MTIYLFGVSNVGKTTTGELLAEKLGYVFYDLDDEVKRYYDMTLEEFVNTGRLEKDCGRYKGKSCCSCSNYLYKLYEWIDQAKGCIGD